MRGLRIVLIALLAAVLFIPAAPALAFDGVFPNGRVVFGENFTLESGETLEGDLLVFGGDVELEVNSQVEGEVIVWGGGIELAGTVEGNVVVFGGNVDLLGTAVIEGDLATIGGFVDREEGAEVYGQQVVNPGEIEWRGPVVLPFPTVGPFVATNAGTHIATAMIWSVMRMFGITVVMAALAGLIAILWPEPAARVGRACLRSPLSTFGMGFLTVIVLAALLVSICLTLIGGLGAIVAGVAGVFGWAALGILIGERIFANRAVNPFWSAALGAGLLTFLGSFLDLIPCVGWIGWFLVACVGLGAVILTRFGTVDYPSLLAAPSAATPALETMEEELEEPVADE